MEWALDGFVLRAPKPYTLQLPSAVKKANIFHAYSTMKRAGNFVALFGRAGNWGGPF